MHTNERIWLQEPRAVACSAIRAGDCSSAVVAGSNLILTPKCQIFSSKLGPVSPSSRCHTFDAAADGYARADGVGALYIKRLGDAIVDRDPIRAMIRSTAINAYDTKLFPLSSHADS